ncbi:PREDICTED: NAC domain-containing protein 5-like isoform X2 [Camelina sativa]|uniref:NAC domain-containing protein 5-like isoform X2 n=1 Tax=Camelina sativa TaxID=90675 RepID=A0ABM0WQ94_CAMSA|nr:PREDICTED: NAC domain-containing protein 5-like isoform X2 [Camelina sativa]
MSLSKVAYPIGVRFRLTEEEIFYYLRVKNLESNTSLVDEVISTVNICSSDPWHLPSMATTIVETTDLFWYFFGRIENKYNKGDIQSRRTQSGFWKKTGKTIDIKRKSGNCEKIGEKRVLMFYLKGGSKSKWVMHEYHATFPYSPPNQMMTYTLCKVKFKGEMREIEESRTLYPAPMNNNDNNIGGLIIKNPCQITGSPLDLDALDWVMDDILSPDFVGLAADDDDEQSKGVYMEEYNRYRPKKPLTGVFSDNSSDSDSISPTTSSIQTSSTCDSFGSSNQIITDLLPESPTSPVKETPVKKKKTYDDDALGTEIGERNKLGQVMMIKNKKAGFFCRMIQKFVKIIQLCSSN